MTDRQGRADPAAPLRMKWPLGAIREVPARVGGGAGGLKMAWVSRFSLEASFHKGSNYYTDDSESSACRILFGSGSIPRVVLCMCLCVCVFCFLFCVFVDSMLTRAAWIPS